MSFLVFLLFAVVQVAMYLSIRREWFPPLTTAAAGVFGSMVSMALFILAQGNTLAHGLIFGMLIGGVFAIATLSIAWYFQVSEMRERGDYAPVQHDTPAERTPEPVPAVEEYYE